MDINPRTTTVEIVSQPACSSCHAAGLCGMSEHVRKAVELPTPACPPYGVGDEVEVLLKPSMGHKAVWLAYVIPLAILMGVLLTALHAGLGELGSALCSAVSVASYYLALWLARGRLRSEYVFAIRTLQSDKTT